MRKISQLTMEERTEAATLLHSNRRYCRHFFPGRETVEQLTTCLHTLGEEWQVTGSEKICAVFTLETSRAFTRINNMCVEASSVNEVAFAMGGLPRTNQTTIIAPVELVTALVKSGFESRGTEARISIAPRESRPMQLLPISRPSEEDVLELSRVMYEAYLASKFVKYSDVAAAEKNLRSLISDMNTDPIRKKSFMSKAGDKIVSACLITGEYSGATVTELFTHPLYRARGLATTELTACMNSLALSKVPLLRASVDEGNDVLIRLLFKMGFAEDIRYTIMTRT